MIDKPPLEVLSTSNNELLKLLAQQIYSVPAPLLICIVTIAYFASAYVPPGIWVTWVIATISIQSARWLSLWKLANISTIKENQKLKLITYLSIISGGAIGTSLLFFPYFTLIEKVIQTTLLICLATGSVAVTLGYMPLFLTFNGTTLIPLSICWLTSESMSDNSWSLKLLGVLIWGYIAVLFGIARGLHGQFLDSYNIRKQRLESNEKLQAALNEARAANEAKTRFLASASHDLRQPIHTLSLFSTTLSMRPLDHTTQNIVSHIDKAVSTLSVQMDSLLDISKLDAGLIDINKSSVNLTATLSQLYSEFEVLAHQKGLNIQLNCIDRAIVETDAIACERIFRNLISNAIKYTDIGTVYIATEKLDERRYKISISDTGKGIALSKQKKIFEEFYQISNPHRDRTHGLGLGLSIVQRLARLLNITIEINSKIGVGSTFSIVLEKSQATPITIPIHKPKPQISLTGLTVLVIDDEPDILKAMGIVLTSSECKALLAANEREAMNFVQHEKPDIIISDYRLRDHSNGIDIIEKIRLTHPMIPAMLISGDTSPQRLRAAEHANLKILSKPVSIDTIIDAISMELSKTAPRNTSTAIN